MVCQGSKYTVELVDAETKIPFKEHCTPNGRVFVEVEPDIDYLIMVDVDGQTKVIADFCVDGKCLGYDSVVFKTRRGKCYNGISSRKDDKLFENCLNFGKIFSFRKDTNIDQSVHSGGNVKVSFYEAIKDEEPDLGRKVDYNDKKGEVIKYKRNSFRDFENPWFGGNVDCDDKKGVHTSIGQSFYADKNDKLNIVDNYTRGDRLKEITLHYTSAIGLIHANILPKPPVWDHHRMVQMFKHKPSIAKTSLVFSKKMKSSFFDENGNLMQSKEYDFFDLSVV